MCTLYEGGDQLYVPYRVQSGNAYPSYVGAMAYIVPETGELSVTAVTDTSAYLVDTRDASFRAGHAFAPLLTDTAMAARCARPRRYWASSLPFGGASRRGYALVLCSRFLGASLLTGPPPLRYGWAFPARCLAVSGQFGSCGIKGHIRPACVARREFR